METSSRTLVCCVVFLDIAEYSKKPVSEQLQLKQAFNGILADAVAQVPARDRIILDTGDGAAITFLGDPEDALFAAMSIRDSAGSLPVRMGVNLGPVRLLKDLNGQMNIIGDGINVAQRIMGFAQPGQLLVSRSFYEVVSRLSRDYTKLFTHAGLRTDKHVREHEVYTVISGATASRRVEETMSRVRRTQRSSGWFARRGPFGLHRGALLAAPLVFMLFSGAGIALRASGERAAAPVLTHPPAAESVPAAAPVSEPLQAYEKAASVPPPPSPTEPKRAPTPVAPATPVAPVASEGAIAPVPVAPRAEPVKPARPAPETHKPETHKQAKRPLRKEITSVPVEKKLARPALVAASGTIEFAISPWGEVVVDGTKRGVSPPLRELELPPGKHTVEIRNTTFPPRVEDLTVRSGESVRLRHRFQ